MNRYRLLMLMAVIALSIPLAVSSAPAWEFSMDGAFTWEYEYRGQSGREGFFGPYDVDNGSGGALVPGFLAPENFWLGFHMPGNDQNPVSSTRGSSFASGSDGSWQTIYMNTNMQIRMNQALRVRGRYYIGKWFTPGVPTSLGEMVASEYVTYMSPGVQRSFSPGYWNTLWLTAELPWGLVAVGKRPSTWGTGIGWNGEDNRSSDSLAFAAPYGPFRVMVSMYPSRRGNTNASYYNQDFDKNNTRVWDMVVPNVTYRSGPVDMGFLFNFVHRHRGGEGILDTPATRSTTNFAGADFDEVYGGVYIKYLNGRCFFNSEVDWDLMTFRNRRKTALGVPWPNVRDTYREHWRFMAEGGVLAGPSKVSVIYAWLAGPDRRNGAQIDRTGLNVDPGIRNNSWSNTGLFRPYSYLMVYSYGLGTHMNADTTNGTVEDASIIATRLDYAVASNLNVYGSFFWADRTNNSGYGWGFIRPAATAATVGQVVWVDRNNATPWVYSPATSAPNIPDPNLGYEIGAGMDWKLLENFTMNLTMSYWKPGKWFSYACIDKAIPNWDTAAAGPFGWGVYPDRNIDPVWGLELKLVGDF